MRFTMERMIQAIKAYSGKPIQIMEVCGTHTMNIARYGIKQILPPQVQLISGPGCPVCVTPIDYFINLFQYIKSQECMIATYGDLLRIPFAHTSLQKERNNGADIRVIYSPLECLELAKQFPHKQIVFLGVGFETTAPLTALLIQKAKSQNLGNIKVALAHKRIIPAIKTLLEDETSHISALLYPGNVGAIIGSNAFKQISYDYQIKGAVCGFTMEEIIQSLYFILYGESLFTNAYKRVVVENGNGKALKMMAEVFEEEDSLWRGLGKMRLSGYGLKPAYAHYGTQKSLTQDEPKHEENKCLCGEILRGKRSPKACQHFAKDCTPFSPMGPCMISSEGSCSAAFLMEEAF